MSAQLYVINVLPTQYYEDCHIAGSIHMPLETLKTQADALERDAMVVVYCAKYACGASGQAYHALHEMGFTNLYAYEGGTAEWHQRGFATQGACSSSYIAEDNQPTGDNRGVREIHVQELMKAMQDHGLL